MANEWFDIASDPGEHRFPEATAREYTFAAHSPSGVMLQVRDVDNPSEVADVRFFKSMDSADAWLATQTADVKTAREAKVSAEEGKRNAANTRENARREAARP